MRATIASRIHDNDSHGVCLDNARYNKIATAIIYFNGGNGIHFNGGSNGSITNTVVYGNNYGVVFGVSSYGGSVTNSIVVNNKSTGVARHGDHARPVSADYNNVYANGGSYYRITLGENYISTNPLFVNADAADFHLLEGSPCIDAGTAVDLAYDFDGNPMPQDGDNDGIAEFDMGAYEVPAIPDDMTPPVTTANITGTLIPPHEWYSSDVTVELSVTDDSSGVNYIRYAVVDENCTVDSESTEECVVYSTEYSSFASIPIASEGTFTVQYYAVDNAGNQEAENSLTINIDKTLPMVDAMPDAESNVLDFLETEIIDLPIPSVSDNLDQNPTVTNDAPASYPIGETVVTVTATDHAGNEGTNQLTVIVVSAETALDDLNLTINSLPTDAFKNNADNRKNAFLNKIAALIDTIEAAKVETDPVIQDELFDDAIVKLQSDIQAKMDGCPDTADNNDWIIDCDAQYELNDLINRVLATLANLRNG
jgi:hypothetical protein